MRYCRTCRKERRAETAYYFLPFLLLFLLWGPSQKIAALVESIHIPESVFPRKKGRKAFLLLLLRTPCGALCVRTYVREKKGLEERKLRNMLPQKTTTACRCRRPSNSRGGSAFYSFLFFRRRKYGNCFSPIFILPPRALSRDGGRRERGKFFPIFVVWEKSRILPHKNMEEREKKKGGQCPGTRFDKSWQQCL